MAIPFSVAAQDSAFAVCAQGKPMATPGRRPLRLPARNLAEAIAAEWQAQQSYASSAMPLTSLAYTALDRIDGQKDAIVEALLVYADTDTLSYRAEPPEKLHKRQCEQWDPILAWMGGRFDVRLRTTAGIMPVDQPPALHAALGTYLRSLDHFQLAAACVLASALSSLVLALAVLEKHTDGENAFRLSRLEEDTQAEDWGQDAEAQRRAQRLLQEILAVTRFLRLLEGG